MKIILLRFCFILTLGLPYLIFAQKAYQAPQLSDPDSWSMILIPDPQSYVKFARNQPLLELMTAWIEDNVGKLNISLVLCTGDMVEQNELLNPDGKNGDQPSKLQWESVSKAFNRLDGKVPYMVTTGNHDFGIVSSENRRTHFNEYFPVDKNPLNMKMLRDVSLDEWGVPTLTNATYEYTSPHGKKMLILVLEFAPREATIEWAKKIVNQEKYKNHEVILLTHSYLNSKSEHIVKEGYALTDANYGKAIWEKLVQPSGNIKMVFAGHIGAPNNPQAHLGFRTDLNAAGKEVQQMVFNAQALGGGWHGNGGDGWLRILEFMPDGKTVKVRTFSPLFAISPSTQHLAWRTEDYDEFSFTLD
ncbi:MAG: metallophosphoesterase [Bacteroidales bacterium]|jgi:hypothetical protein|nr:metallophosphoesterase [Bacteroidales bacterium]